MKEYGSIALYAHYFKIQFKSAMQYKGSFILTCIGQFLVSFNVFLGVYFMFRRFHSVSGYSYSEVLLCFGITLMEFSLAEAVARGFDTFASMISNGVFDRIMVRPRNEIFQVLGQKIEFTRIGRMLQAVIMFAYGIMKSEITWTVPKIFAVLFMLLGGTALFCGIFLIYAALCFFTLEGLEFMNILTDGAREYGKYPVNIYGKKLLLLCTFVVPYALVQYYPLMYLLGRGRAWYILLPAGGFIFLLPCYGFWRLGLHHYKSTGS